MERTRILSEQPLASDTFTRTILRESVSHNQYEKSYDYEARIVVIDCSSETFRIGVGNMLPTSARLENASKFSAKRLAEITVPDAVRQQLRNNCLENERVQAEKYKK